MYYKNSEYISICANGGSIHIKDLFDNKGKKIKIDDIALGSRFYTPTKFLESAKIKKEYFMIADLKQKNNIRLLHESRRYNPGKIKLIQISK